MNITPILNWDYEPPIEPGLYLCCYGDVETVDNVKLVKFFECGGKIKTDEGFLPTDYSTGCKWARLLIGSAAMEFVE